MQPNRLTTQILLTAYQMGVFPMAVPEMHNDLFWFAPDPRAVLPLDAFRVSKSLQRTLRQGRFEVVFDQDFETVIRNCAKPRSHDCDTWISDEIIGAYTQLHRIGAAHTVECYLAGKLVGGLYGISIGGAFFGESMFHCVRDSSKVAMAHLVRHLREQGYQLLDVQYQTPHLKRFGVIEIPRHEYEELLSSAILLDVHW